VTPSANLAANISAGLPQVLTDPRTNLLQSLEAIIIAELADNECWTALAELAQQAGHQELVEECREAIAHERDHLRQVRLWIASGQGRTTRDDSGAEISEGADGDEFTFAEDGPVDREGYVVSEEDRAETREAAGSPQAGKSGKGRPEAT
jgi:rubrerythrin